MMKVLLILSAGTLGTLVRYLISFLPFGTIIANALGCLLLGFFLSIGKDRELFSPQYMQAISIGFLGALTTFSTFTAETVEYLEANELFLAFGYVAVNLLFGLALFFAGNYCAGFF